MLHRGRGGGLDHVRRCTPAGIPDLVLLDLRMPVLDGRAVYHALQSDGHVGLPVIIMTGEPPALVASDFPGVRVIPKPFAPDDLLAAVRAALGS